MTDCNKDFLLSVKYERESVYISVFVAGYDDSGSEVITQLHLLGHQPPSNVECGEDLFRCKNYLTVKNPSFNSTIIFVPLHNALLLVKFVSNDSHLTLQQHHLINMTNFNCTPITSLEIVDSIYTVCLNLEQSYLSLFEIRLDMENLTRSVRVGPLARNYFHLSANAGLSEFKYVEVQRFHFIYFAYANYIFYFEPLNYLLDYAGALPQNCTSVHKLVYVNDDTLLSYCRSGATVSFDVAFQYWTEYRPYSLYGRPYRCQNINNNVQVTVFSESGHVHYSNTEARDHTMNKIELVGENFTVGECFGDGSGFYFVYVDRIEGIFILNLSTFNFTQLSSTSCSNTTTDDKCQHLQVLNNRYLVVQQFDGNQNTVTALNVYDSKMNFQKIGTFTGPNANFNLISTITDSKDIPCLIISTSMSPGTTATTEQKTVSVELTTDEVFAQESNSFVIEWTIGVCIAVLLVLLIIVAVLIFIVITFKLRIESTNSTR